MSDRVDPLDNVFDYPTAWALQREVGEALMHDARCSSVPGASALSGPMWLCDCGALVTEWERRRGE